jgi:hypothetical protein
MIANDLSPVVVEERVVIRRRFGLPRATTLHADDAIVVADGECDSTVAL